ncbi:MAG: LysR family transcriptional regulator [Gammaproteobacteria bacterium]|nr:LysR family transcriptional regulator [Gammaproteobacteria bacterium]
MSDEISDLRLFTRIVAAGSLSETARRIHSSLPAVSRRLAAMEERLGVRLIDRGSRRFTLTEEGGVLYERALTILRDLDAAEAEATAQAKHPRGRMRVGAPLEIGRRRIAPLVAEFTARYPGISIELVLSDSRVDILEEEIDIGIHVDVPQDSNLISRVLLYGSRVIIASPEYLARHPAPAKPIDLLEHDCARLVRGRRVFDHWMFKEDGRVREVQVQGTLLTNNSEVMHEWALAGRAVTIKALWDVEDDIRAGRLVQLLKPFQCDELNLYATYATRTHLPPRMRLFIDFVVQELSAPQPRAS